MSHKIRYNVGDKIGDFSFLKDLSKKGNHRQILVLCSNDHKIEIDRISARNGTKCRECRTKRIGKKIYEWTILGPADPYICKTGQKINRFNVQCSCGTKSIKSLANLKTKSCKKCVKKYPSTKMVKSGRSWIDFTGKQYEHFKVIKELVYPEYECLCICGLTFKVNRRELKANDVQSCGCIRRKNEFQSIINRAFYQHHKDAENRNYKSEITLEQYSEILQTPCVYCGSFYIRTNKHTGATLKLNSLDRKNNEPYYSLENVQSCCLICQRAKSDLTHEEYISHMNNLIKFRTGDPK